MSPLIPGPEASVSQHLRATKKILQDIVFGAGYVQVVKMTCVITEFWVCRVLVVPDAAEVRQTDEVNAWTATDARL